MASPSEAATDQNLSNAPATSFDESGFTRLVEGHRRELQVHCYRMLGSFEDSEDLVQETYLRAWRKRDTFEGRSTARAWLYRIATNACLDFLDRHPRMPTARRQPPLGADPAVPVLGQEEVAWLQPFPDQLMDPMAPTEAEPDAVVISKETIELAFLVAIQHLPPQQRAVLMLRDVLGWSANETAAALAGTVASVNSALQRARATLKERLPARRIEWAPASEPSDAERKLLQRCIEALERSDTQGFAELLREDVRVTMPPDPLWILGRDTFAAGLAAQFDPESPIYVGQWRAVATWANRQPAMAAYVRQPGESVYRPQVLNVFRVEDGLIAEITAFQPNLFPAFGLPATL